MATNTYVSPYSGANNGNMSNMDIYDCHNTPPPAALDLGGNQIEASDGTAIEEALTPTPSP